MVEASIAPSAAPAPTPSPAPQTPDRRKVRGGAGSKIGDHATLTDPGAGAGDSGITGEYRKLKSGEPSPIGNVPKGSKQRVHKTKGGVDADLATGSGNRAKRRMGLAEALYNALCDLGDLISEATAIPKSRKRGTKQRRQALAALLKDTRKGWMQPHETDKAVERMTKDVSPEEKRAIRLRALQGERLGSPYPRRMSPEEIKLRHKGKGRQRVPLNNLAKNDDGSR